MEQFELRFIVCGNDLAATHGCAKILFGAPLPGKVTLRQDGKFLLRHRDHRIRRRRIARLAGGIDLRSAHGDPVPERVESVLSKLGLPYCIFEGTEISPDSQLGEMAQALGAELLFQASGRRSRSTNSARNTSPPWCGTDALTASYPLQRKPWPSRFGTMPPVRRSRSRGNSRRPSHLKKIRRDFHADKADLPHPGLRQLRSGRHL